MSLYLFQHGMTPLMNAAYKGKAEMCELLLAQGADVNSNYHEHQVSTFSKIVNSIFKVKMLLKLVTLLHEVMLWLTCCFSLKMNLGIVLKIILMIILVFSWSQVTKLYLF